MPLIAQTRLLSHWPRNVGQVSTGFFIDLPAVKKASATASRLNFVLPLKKIPGFILRYSLKSVAKN